MAEFFKQIYFSCTDFSFYKKIVRQKLSQSLKYFIFLLLIVAAISSVAYCYYFKIALNLFNEWSQKHMPEMTIENGVVHSNVSQPYTAVEDDFVFILDTTGEVTRINSLYPNGVLVNESSLTIKRMGQENQRLDLSWIDYLQISAPIVAAWKEKLMPMLIPFVFIFTILGLAISKFFQAFLFSYGASIFFPKERTGLGLQELFTLALYSATPPILISLVAQVLGLQIPAFWWIYFGMYAAFFIGAFTQCRVIKENNQEKDIDLDL